MTYVRIIAITATIGVALALISIADEALAPKPLVKADNPITQHGTK